MRTIVFFNLKGGVGKTVTTANVAAILAARYGRRVLLIDADGQGNLSQYFDVPAEEGCTTLDLLEGTCESCYADMVNHTKRKNIDIIPADMSLMDADIDAIKDGRCNLQAIADLRDAIEEDNGTLESQSEDVVYDYILIDCPPAFTAASIAALAAADSVVIPIKLDAFSTAGMSALVQQVRNMQRINDRLEVAGVLPTMFCGTDSEKQAIEALQEFGVRMCRTRIRNSKRVSDSTFARTPMIEFSPHSAATRDYRTFVKELIGGRDDG